MWGGTVAKWVALMPQSKEVMGLIPRWVGPVFSVWGLHVLLVTHDRETLVKNKRPGNEENK